MIAFLNLHWIMLPRIQESLRGVVMVAAVVVWVYWTEAMPGFQAPRIPEIRCFAVCCWWCVGVCVTWFVSDCGTMRR